MAVRLDTNTYVGNKDGDRSNVKSITIPTTVTSIGSSAFKGYSLLMSVTIPSTTVTSIGDRAFIGCSSLQSITLPPTVISIGDFVFWGCSSLVSITLPPTIKSIGIRLFSGCSSLESIAIPPTVTSLGNYAFAECISLKSITLPPSVRSIGMYAFFRCLYLESITLSPTIRLIRNYVFYQCSSLRSIDLLSSPSSGECFETARLFEQVVQQMTPQNMKLWSRTKNKDGKLPLTTAAAISLKWTTMERIFNANKPAVYEIDEETGLPLSILAAVGPKCDIDSVYSLCKEHPIVLMPLSIAGAKSISGGD